MCGIFGLFDRASAVSGEAIRSGIDALRHRGPDGVNVWLAADGRAAVAHALLSIASLDGAQPIASEDGGLQLVANGEFYGHRQLRRRLELAGHRFATETDSEVALHLFEERGPAALDELRGEFAFLIWDDRKKRLVAARDRFGIKPLFYAVREGAIMLASETKALFAAGHKPAWDQRVVYEQLFGGFRPDASLFAGIRQIPPGYFLTWSGGAPELHRYWDLDFPMRGQERAIGEEEAVAETRRLLVEAVRLRQEAAVPVGYLVSGGLDSTTVMSIAAEHSATPVRAFCIAFEGERYDESEKARLAVTHAGARLDVVPVTDTELAESFADSVRLGETLQVNAHGTARFVLSREINRAGYRAVMAGEGADELFGGYGFLRPALNGAGGRLDWGDRARLLWHLAKPTSAENRPIARISPVIERLSRAPAFPPSVRQRAIDGATLWLSVLSPEFTQEAGRHDPYLPVLRSIPWRDQVLRRERTKQLLYLWFRSIFPSYHMAADRMDMAHAVEVRLPFLDHPLVEFCGAVPMCLHAKDGRNKHLLREAARPFISDQTYHGAKQPFYAPPRSLVPGGRFHEFVRETLRSAVVAEQPFFSQQALIELLDKPAEHRLPRAMLDPLLMVVLSLSFIDRELRARAVSAA